MRELIETTQATTSEAGKVRQELSEIDQLLDDVLKYRACQTGQPSKTSLDRVTEEELSPANLDGAWNISSGIAAEMMTQSYNLAINKLKDVSDDIPEREEVPENGSVDIYESNKPYIGGLDAGPSIGGPDTLPQGRNPRSHFEELTENAAILGYHLETLAREPSELIDEEELEPHPKDWVY